MTSIIARVLAPRTSLLLLDLLQRSFFRLASYRFDLGGVEVERKLTLGPSVCDVLAGWWETAICYYALSPSSLSWITASPRFASPSCPRSKSFKTRSRAASLARTFSSSASRFRTSSLSFCLLISFFCVTSHHCIEQSAGRHFEDARTKVCVHAFLAEKVSF
jgi:hypothetical protein